jgi:hypothetical protein
MYNYYMALKRDILATSNIKLAEQKPVALNSPRLHALLKTPNAALYMSTYQILDRYRYSVLPQDISIAFPGYDAYK